MSRQDRKFLRDIGLAVAFILFLMLIAGIGQLTR